MTSRGHKLINLATKRIVGESTHGLSTTSNEIRSRKPVRRLSFSNCSPNISSNSSSSSCSHISATESSSEEDCDDLLNDQTYDPNDEDNVDSDNEIGYVAKKSNEASFVALNASSFERNSSSSSAIQAEIHNLTVLTSMKIIDTPCTIAADASTTSSQTISKSFENTGSSSASQAEIQNIDTPSTSVADTSTSSSERISSSSTGKGSSPVAPVFVSPADKGVKRRRNPSKWKRSVAKKLRNTGQEYVDRKQKVHTQKSVKSPCENCRLACSEKFSEAERNEIFSAFWQLGSIDKQRQYIADCMKIIQPKYRYTREDKKRQNNNAFSLSKNGEAVRVCKKFFRNTLDVNDRVIRTVVEKRAKVADHVLEDDRRGKHKKQPSLDENIREGIRRHIESIPKIESHYIRAKSSRQYIDGSKSIADIHRDYVAVCEEKKEPHASYTIFYQVFNNEFNISFFVPKKYLCETCVSYENADEEGKQSRQEKYDRHLKEKELSRGEKKRDKENFNGLVAVYDLQAVMQVPKGNVSVFYYKCKLNVFNFTIYDLKSGSCESYVWDEASGHRGVNELGSCVLHYLQKKKANSDDTEVIFYSDNCAGQQKNKFMLALYVYAVQHLGIKSITHKYLIKGHTQNEGDSVHSLVERQVKRQLRGGPMYTPEAFITAIRGAKKKGGAIIVNEMSCGDFIDLKDLATKIGPLNMKSIKIGDVKVLRVIQESPLSVFYKNSYEEVEFTEAKIIKKATAQDILLKPAFQSKPTLPENKRRDLLELLQKNHIPKTYEHFFKNL